SVDPEPESQGDALFLLQPLMQVSHGIEDTEPSPYCSVRVIFMGLGIAKVHQESIPEQLSNMPIVALDNVGTYLLVCTDDFAILFRVESGGEFRRVYQVAEHHSELPSFRFGCTRVQGNFDLGRVSCLAS